MVLEKVTYSRKKCIWSLANNYTIIYEIQLASLKIGRVMDWHSLDFKPIAMLF